MKQPQRISKKLKEQTIENIKEILGRNPQIRWNEIKLVGLIETGQFQYNVPETISNLKVITLLAYLKWYFNIGDELK